MPTRATPHVLSWASDLDYKVLAQAERTGKMPFLSGYVALMPDAHLGMGATIGSVIPTQGAIIPAAVGVDIGCGMIAVETAITETQLPDDLTPLLSRIEQVVPAGVGKGHASTVHAGDLWYQTHPNENVKQYHFADRAINQFGSLGSGNHFIEICLPTSGTDRNVWAVLHSGSRGVGNKLAMRHIKTAKRLMKRMFISLPDPDLAYLVEQTPEFQDYIHDLMWAQDYALASREAMMDAVLDELKEAVGLPVKELLRINCHHNYVAREFHHGQNLWVTRKGAIRARRGDLGVIPGSMGTNTFIVRGKGNEAAYESCAHGAGRRMSRTQAKKDFSAEDLAETMKGKTWLANKAQSLIDEIPGSYKDINQVMHDQADLVEVVAQLTQILNYKGA